MFVSLRNVLFSQIIVLILTIYMHYFDKFLHENIDSVEMIPRSQFDISASVCYQTVDVTTSQRILKVKKIWLVKYGNVETITLVHNLYRIAP